MSAWQFRTVPLKFQLSDWTLFSVSIPLQVRSVRIVDQVLPVSAPMPPSYELIEGSQGFLVRGMPVQAALPRIGQIGDFICYAPLQYQHCYIDLGQSFESYQKKFSSKTRSTINRKTRKYAEHCGGAISWKTYRASDEMREFFRHARTVSQLTYQEKLLDAGIPDAEEFIADAEDLAAQQRVRAYILFDGERPVSYLYCPVEDGVLNYAYLGYDPDYMHLSVGIVLQWLALEQLFNEACFRYFDFTEGQSQHKLLFATHQQQCANVFFVKKTLRNSALIKSHMSVDRLSNAIGAALDRFGVKEKVRRLLRSSG